MAACPGFQDAAVDSDSMLQQVGTASDSAWHQMTGHGFCGGCGLDVDHCHPGQCCSEEKDLLRVMDSVCGRCPERVSTGQIRAVVL